jgi:hypothetical protein
MEHFPQMRERSGTFSPNEGKQWNILSARVTRCDVRIVERADGRDLNVLFRHDARPPNSGIAVDEAYYARTGLISSIFSPASVFVTRRNLLSLIVPVASQKD